MAKISYKADRNEPSTFLAEAEKKTDGSGTGADREKFRGEA